MSVTAVLPDASALQLAAIEKQGGARPGLSIHEGTPDPGELIRRVQGHAIVIDNESYFTRDILARCPDLRAIVFLGTGASSYIDLDACEERGIVVRNIAGYGNRTVAEHAAALMFAIYRDIGNQHATMRAGSWTGRPIGELQGRTLGLLGLGAIGREMAAIGQALGMSVIGWSRSGRPVDGVEPHSFEAVLGRADVLSLHLALNAETAGMLGGAQLAAMKPGSVLINTARGAIVDEVALISALESGHLAGAGLDVFAVEPLPAGHALRAAPNCILSAHTGWQSPEAIDRLMAMALKYLDEERSRLNG